MTLDEKASTFRRLHQGPEILILPNAWDVASARMFEVAGFPAIGTTSAGIAASLGYPDGQYVSRDEMLEVVARIARAVKVPVSADIESGYGDPIETARALVEAGAVGMNLEDVCGAASEALTDLTIQTGVIREIRALELPLVVNARTDVYLANIGEPETRLTRTLERLNAFRDAGADCLFAPGVTDSETISVLAAHVRGPLNVLANKGTPIARELQRLGVARVSVGSGVSRAALATVRRIAHELRDLGSFAAMLQDQVPYAEVNQMLAPNRLE